MANIQIRKYRDDDAEAVKELFTLEMSKYVHSSFMHLLKQPLIQIVLTSLFWALQISSNSFLLAVLALTFLLSWVREYVIFSIDTYINTSFKEEISNISENYLKQKDSCFWVAKSDGRVVGTVACLPNENAPECLELKCMHVLHSRLEMDIAKALGQTVADFTRDRGYAAVILYTSVVQTYTHKLYEHIGYEKIREFAVPKLCAKILNFTVFEYRLNHQRDGKQD